MMAGVTEEIAFRELPISYMARQWRDEKKIPLMVIIPGTAFGLTHLSNIVGSKPTDTLAQVALSMLFGIFFSAVYVRTGSIWAVLIQPEQLNSNNVKTQGARINSGLSFFRFP